MQYHQIEGSIDSYDKTYCTSQHKHLEMMKFQ